MGPLVMVGLAALGAGPAIGWISASTWQPPELFARGLRSPRRLTVVLMAFCEGLGILGFVVGALAVFVAGRSTAADALLAALPAVAGALIGLALSQRDRDRQDAVMTVQAGTFIVGLGILGVVSAFLATSVSQGSPGPNDGALFVGLGLVQAAAALGIGATGARSIREMQRVSAQAVELIYRRQLGRAVAFQFIGVAAFGVAVARLLGG